MKSCEIATMKIVDPSYNLRKCYFENLGGFEQQKCSDFHSGHISSGQSSMKSSTLCGNKSCGCQESTRGKHASRLLSNDSPTQSRYLYRAHFELKPLFTGNFEIQPDLIWILAMNHILKKNLSPSQLCYISIWYLFKQHFNLNCFYTI